MQNGKKLKNLSDRLVHALETLNVTQAELARRLEIKPQAIHYLCNSQSKKSSFTYEIADALKINSLWLGCGEGTMLIQDDPEIQFIRSQQRIPILNPKQVKHWINNNEFIKNLSEEWVLTSSNAGKSGFAFQLSDKSMYPRFEQDSIIIINSEKIAKDKDFVLVYLKESDNIIFRQYQQDDINILLKPMNTKMYKTITKNDTDPILGVMVETRWQL